MSDTRKILALGGDGIGPEVVASGLQVLEVIAAEAGLAVEIEEDLLHGAAYDRHGTFCRDETLAAARQADAILVGAVGGPKWDGIRFPGGPEMQDGLMRLRLELDFFAGLRPAKTFDCLTDLTPYRHEVVSSTDVMVLREMCGGVYFALPRGREPEGGRAFDTTAYHEAEIARIAHAAFQLARRRRGQLVSCDKANVMESGVLWREVVTAIAPGYPDVSVTHLYADNAVYQLALQPSAFDVILADNLFGDILSDQIGAFTGALGLLPSACLPGLPGSGERTPGIYEAVHGSAPDIAGQGIANPVGTLLSMAMLLDYSLARPDLAKRLEAAIESALAQGFRTPDLKGEASTQTVTDAVIAAYRS